VDVLVDTHEALVPGGLLLDFHPVVPPWPRVEARGRRLVSLRDRNFPGMLRATEEGLEQTVREGRFRRLASRTHDIREYYDDAEDLLDGWGDESDEWISPEVRRRLEAVTGPVDVVERLVFRLYRAA
jgi:hypothetical protein